MNYSLFIAILAFLAAVQLTSKFNIRPLFGALIAVVLPYAINTAIKWIYAAGYHLPIAGNVFSLASITSVLLQFTFSLLIFKKIRDTDNMGTILGWGVGGMTLIIFAIPLITERLFSLF